MKMKNCKSPGPVHSTLTSKTGQLFKRYFLGPAVVAFALAGSSTCLAQLPTATLLGTVTDASKGRIVGATVTVRNDSGASRRVTTGPDGSYRFSALAIGA